MEKGRRWGGFESGIRSLRVSRSSPVRISPGVEIPWTPGTSGPEATDSQTPRSWSHGPGSSAGAPSVPCGGDIGETGLSCPPWWGQLRSPWDPAVPRIRTARSRLVTLWGLRAHTTAKPRTVTSSRCPDRRDGHPPVRTGVRIDTQTPVPAANANRPSGRGSSAPRRPAPRARRSGARGLVGWLIDYDSSSSYCCWSRSTTAGSARVVVSPMA